MKRISCGARVVESAATLGIALTWNIASEGGTYNVGTVYEITP